MAWLLRGHNVYTENIYTKYLCYKVFRSFGSFRPKGPFSFGSLKLFWLPSSTFAVLVSKSLLCFKRSLVRYYFTENNTEREREFVAGMVAHPVMQVIGEQALVDILDLSEFAWTCWGVSTPRSGLGLRMVKELDLQLALGMNERRNTGSLPVYDIMHS